MHGRLSSRASSTTRYRLLGRGMGSSGTDPSTPCTWSAPLRTSRTPTNFGCAVTASLIAPQTLFGPVERQVQAQHRLSSIEQCERREARRWLNGVIHSPYGFIEELVPVGRLTFQVRGHALLQSPVHPLNDPVWLSMRRWNARLLDAPGTQLHFQLDTDERRPVVSDDLIRIPMPPNDLLLDEGKDTFSGSAGCSRVEVKWQRYTFNTIYWGDARLREKKVKKDELIDN